jgi:hypothetical protein
VTKIQLPRLQEEDIISYVAATLCKPKDDAMALAVVIQAKSAGNPFYIREMLSACYRKRCIWYDYHESQWRYDLNKVFEEFQGGSDYDVLNTDFITSRLSELPPASRSILAWGALLGNSFSFELICHLLSGEFRYAGEPCNDPSSALYTKVYTQGEAVAGLQAAIQACVLTSSDSDDRFRFAHDRYVQAASSLKECSAGKMHFLIAQALMKYYGTDSRSKDATAAHICECEDIIREQVKIRRPYRTLLFDCARLATENGARRTAQRYYSHAIYLLQPHPWVDKDEETSYNETLQLHLRSAECALYLGQHSLANTILDTVFKSARDSIDKAPASVLQSRLYAQSGNALGALACLRGCLNDIGVAGLDKEPTFGDCDEEYQRLAAKLKMMDRSQILFPPSTPDERLSAIGAVMAEAISSAWWSDRLNFYHLSIIMLEMHLQRGAFRQSGMAFIHVAQIALSRFNEVQFAIDLGTYALELLEKFKDPFSMARGYVIYANFIGHVQYPIRMTTEQLDGAIEYGAAAGDRISAILSFGLAGMMKLFASEPLADVEAFCQYGCEEIPNWHQDTRGGTMLIATRQVSRALMGRTKAHDALEVMSDDQHNSSTYKAWVIQNTNNGNRSLLFYESIEMIPLFLYGHYDRAVEVGKTCLKNAELIWSARSTRLVMLFHGLALAGLLLRQRQDPRHEERSSQADETLEQLRSLTSTIANWCVVSDVNYLSWVRLLEAQMSEISNDHGKAIRQYEEALDHSAEQNLVFEEALGNYLMAGIFIRQSARRSARSMLRDSVALFHQLGAIGIADRIEAEHSFLLHGPTRNPRTVEVGVQTDFTGDTSPAPYQRDEVEVDGINNQTGLVETPEEKGQRIGAWRGSMRPEEGATGLPELDMIDLHAILVSSQVISSVLQVDQLLKTMCDVVLQTCGGSATLAAIIVQDDGMGDWVVAASGDPEKGAEAHIPRIPLAGTNLVAENIVLYSTRFREPALVADVVADERFGNVSQSWLQKNPLSKAVIAIPIGHGSNPRLGVLYLEGPPGSFTDRNFTVLQLLVNQIGISYSNALSIKNIEKVSAENVSMLSMQKEALIRSIEAEAKAKAAEKEARHSFQVAKAAEKEAKRNVKLAEEAAKAKGLFLANISHELR